MNKNPFWRDCAPAQACEVWQGESQGNANSLASSTNIFAELRSAGLPGDPRQGGFQKAETAACAQPGKLSLTVTRAAVDNEC